MLCCSDCLFPLLFLFLHTTMASCFPFLSACCICAAVLASCSPLSVPFCSDFLFPSTLLYVFLAATMTSCFTLLFFVFVFPGAALSSCPPFLFFLLLFSAVTMNLGPPSFSLHSVQFWLLVPLGLFLFFPCCYYDYLFPSSRLSFCNFAATRASCSLFVLPAVTMTFVPFYSPFS